MIEPPICLMCENYMDNRRTTAEKVAITDIAFCIVVDYA